MLLCRRRNVPPVLSSSMRLSKSHGGRLHGLVPQEWTTGQSEVLKSEDLLNAALYIRPRPSQTPVPTALIGRGSLADAAALNP